MNECLCCTPDDDPARHYLGRCGHCSLRIPPIPEMVSAVETTASGLFTSPLFFSFSRIQPAARTPTSNSLTRDSFYCFVSEIQTADTYVEQSRLLRARSRREVAFLCIRAFFFWCIFAGSRSEFSSFIPLHM